MKAPGANFCDWPKVPVEPYTKFPAHFESSESFRMASIIFMRRLIADDAKMVKQITDFSRDRPFKL
jgi:hypothetical protein